MTPEDREALAELLDSKLAKPSAIANWKLGLGMATAALAIGAVMWQAGAGLFVTTVKANAKHAEQDAAYGLIDKRIGDAEEDVSNIGAVLHRLDLGMAAVKQKLRIPKDD